MKLVNFETTLPYFAFTSDMFDFESVCYDEDIICIPFSLKLYCNGCFDAIRDVFEERMREFYFEENWNEGIIDGEFSLIVWNEDTDCSYRLQFLAKDCDIEMEIKLTDQEKSILSPIVQKAFGYIDVDKIRENIAQTFGGYISEDVLDKLMVISDVIDGKEYRSAWITDDNQACVIAKIEDVQDKNCPVKMVKFGC